MMVSEWHAHNAGQSNCCCACLCADTKEDAKAKTAHLLIKYEISNNPVLSPVLLTLHDSLLQIFLPQKLELPGPLCLQQKKKVNINTSVLITSINTDRKITQRPALPFETTKNVTNCDTVVIITFQRCAILKCLNANSNTNNARFFVGTKTHSLRKPNMT